MACVGIAIGVALIFAVLVSNESVGASARQITEGVSGAAQLQLSSRDGRGFPIALLEAVRRIDGVVHAAPLLEERAVLDSGDGQSELPVTLASADPRLAALSGALTVSFPLTALGQRGVVLPAAVAKELGLRPRATQTVVRPRPTVAIELRGRRVVAPVTGVVGADTIGVLADAQIAIAPLSYLQEITGLRGRVTRVLVEVAAGKIDAVRRSLAVLAQGRLAVTAVGADAQLLQEATRPNDQAAAFFAAISILVGLLLGFNAMLLTAPERRRVVAELRLIGFRPSQVIQAFAVQALVLGLVASALGVALGTLLARTLLHASPDYLASVFPIGEQTIVTTRAVVIAIVAGLVVTFLAAAPPLFELRRSSRVASERADTDESASAISQTVRRRLLLAGIVMVVLTNGVLLLVPGAAFVAGAGLALSTLLVIPTALKVVLDIAERVAARSAALNPLMTATLGLRATTVRALALAAIGATAVFGALALDGSRRDLLNGLYRGYGEYVTTAHIWVVNPRDDLATKDIRADHIVQRVASVDGVSSVRPYFGAFLDFSGRRVWVIGRPPTDSSIVPRHQLVSGRFDRATAELRRGGWVTVSDQIAKAQGLGVGDWIRIPAPSGMVRFRIAATTDNLGWTSGAMIVNARDFQQAWGTHDPSAIEVDLLPGVVPTVAESRIRAALGGGSGLLVQSAGQRAAQANALARQGLARLTDISVLLVIAAALAMAAAMGTSIWQRRPRLAGMRLQGYVPRQLWRILLLESVLVVGTGCVVGATLGIYGQWLSDRWLSSTTGFPTVFSAVGWEAPAVAMLVVALASAIVAVPGWAAARAPKHLGLQEPV
jgi:putative ABC transport system permease protein